MYGDPRPVTPHDLRKAHFKSAVRGYDANEVTQMLRRAAAVIEQLLGDPVAANTQARISARELRNAELSASFRGFNRDEVNALCERAAATIDELRRAGDELDNTAAAQQSAPISNPPAPPEHLASDPLIGGGARDDDRDFIAPANGAAPTPHPTEQTTQQTTEQTTEQTTQQPTQQHAQEPAQTATASAGPSLSPASVATDALIGSGSDGRARGRGAIRVALGARTYHIVIGDDLRNEAVSVVHQHGVRKVAIVTQPNVAAIAAGYGAALEARGIEHCTLMMHDGEAAKSLATVDALCRSMADAGLLRGDAVFAVGGGVVGDTAGFAASAYYRGVAVVQIPTTLLAMVDASIGGKTAVNLPQGKNLIGSFHQPIAVLCDPNSLATLPDREYRCGLGEVLKYALMGDPELLEIVAKETDELLARNNEVLQRAITRSAAVKARFVSADEHERTGLREHLNYGHTLAHAVETAANHAFAHGEAVAVGLVFAGELAGALERISPEQTRQHRDLAVGLGLPVSLPSDLRRADLIALMKRDKKAVGGLRFVLQGPTGLERVDDPDGLALDVAFNAVGLRD